MTTHTASPNASHLPLTTLLAQWVYTLALVSVLGMALAVLALSLADLAWRGQIYPGVQVWGRDLSGQTPAQAALAVRDLGASYLNQAHFTLRAGTAAWQVTPAQLGLQLDVAATVTQAYRVGRSGDMLADWATMLEVWYYGRAIAPVFVWDEVQARAYLDAVARDTFVPVVEAGLVVQGTQVAATPGQVGQQLDVLLTLGRLRAHLLAFEPATLELPFIVTPPDVLDASAQAQTAQTMLSQPLQLTIAQPQPGDPATPWQVDVDTLGQWLRVRRMTDNGATRYTVALDEDAVRAFLRPLVEPLRRQAVNARFTFNDDTRQLELWKPAQDARELNIEATLAAINAQLPQGQHTVALVFDVTPALIGNTATAESLGIREVVSEQSTTFAGSPAERITNIEVASARFQGLLIPPGGTFSFNEWLGDVTSDSGFAEALIIYGGRTIRGVGGGVCQVSTTAFRAAYFGGFPIVERHAHAYRVGYYERGSWRGPGLDAAIFAPLVDFKFQNDLSSWLLMEIDVYPTFGRMTWRLYGTSDGRQVRVNPVVIENVTPAPEPLYVENPALPTGEIKQVDYAAEGAETTVTRIITRAGVQVNASERPLRTRYQPWRAVYEYGPGTPLPTPTPTP